jgi:hypothetical protein
VDPIGARLLPAGGGGRGEDTDREGPPLHGPGHGHQAGGHQVREQGRRGRSVYTRIRVKFELSNAESLSIAYIF